MDKKEKAKWLKEMREHFKMTRKTLAKLTGLTEMAIYQIESGRRTGSDETWQILESVLSNKMVDKINQDGIKIQIPKETYYQMIDIVEKRGLEEGVIIDYISSTIKVFNEIIENQKDIIGSEYEKEFDVNVARVLKILFYDAIYNSDMLLKYFIEWLDPIDKS